MKLVLTTLFTLCLLSIQSSFAFEAKQLRPFEKNPEAFMEFHKSLIDVLIEKSKNEKYPSSVISEGEYSLIERINDINILELFIASAFALESDVCFFGGWPSLARSGSCKTPWSYKDSSKLKAYGNVYDSGHYCSTQYKAKHGAAAYNRIKSAGKELFRCNPMFFGPGKEEDNGKGACVELTGYNDVTKVCYEQTKGDLNKVFEKYKTDPEFKEAYLKVAADMTKFCERNSRYGACKYLMANVLKIKELTCGEDERLNDFLGKETVFKLLSSWPSIHTEVTGKDLDLENSEANYLGYAPSLAPSPVDTPALRAIAAATRDTGSTTAPSSVSGFRRKRGRPHVDTAGRVKNIDGIEGTLVMPVPAANCRRTSRYKMRRLHGRTKMHPGVDIAAPVGTPVMAVAAGRVAMVAGGCVAGKRSCNSGFGNYVFIAHKTNGKTWYSSYNHLHRISVRAGQTVAAGGQIGTVGNTGYSTGPHLHIEIMNGNQQRSNPELYFPGKNICSK